MIQVVETDQSNLRGPEARSYHGDKVAREFL